jgi:uncharacterized protein
MAEPTFGRVSFLEIGSGDGAVTRAFFGAVFGWPCQDEAWLQTPDLKVGSHGEDPIPQIYVYFYAPDLEAAAARVRAAGGEAGELKEEPGFGRFIHCRDPAGVSFGLHQAME